jgi:hypothetical protein
MDNIETLLNDFHNEVNSKIPNYAEVETQQNIELEADSSKKIYTDFSIYYPKKVTERFVIDIKL